MLLGKTNFEVQKNLNANIAEVQDLTYLLEVLLWVFFPFANLCWVNKDENT